MKVRNCKLRLLTAARKFARLSLVVGAAALVFSCDSAPRKSAPTENQANTSASTSSYTATLSSMQVVDGSLVMVDVIFKDPQQPNSIEAEFEKKRFPLYDVDQVAKHFQGLFGIPHSHDAGPATLKITPKVGDPLTLKFTIADAHYPSETLKVDNRKINPRKSDMVRIKKEIAEINKVYGVETVTKFWDGAFVHPTDTIITDQFGMRRLYNGQLRSYHGGMDFRAAIGTPIHASAAGRVLLAKDLFYSGGTVIIDHGYGLLTMYFHQSKIIAKKGQMIKQGDLIGLSGKTGRVTGPHLHFQVVVHGTKVNPKDLFEELK